MARAIWTGSISFGLVNVPVRMYSAIDGAHVHFHLVHETDDSRSATRRSARRRASRSRTTRSSRRTRSGRASSSTSRTRTSSRCGPRACARSRSQEFVPVDEIDPIYFERIHLPGPGRRGREGVRAARAGDGGGRSRRDREVRDAGEAAPRLPARARGCDRARAACTSRTRSGRSTECGPRRAQVAEEELEMARQLIDASGARSSRSGTRTPIGTRCCGDRGKRKGEDVHAEPESERAEPPTDLLEALRASVEAHGRRGCESRRRERGARSARQPRRARTSRTQRGHPR